MCSLCEQPGYRVVLQASDRLYRTTEKQFCLVSCTNCSLLRLHPVPPPDELQNYYPDTYWFAPGQSVAARLEEAYRTLVLRDHLNFVESALARAGTDGVVLDIGCGGALFGKLLRARGHACVGLDNSKQAARVGWAVNRVPVVVGDFLNGPFAAESFRAITMFHVLEHLYNPVQALRAIGCLLRPGGRLIVQVPNASSWQFSLLGAGWNGIDVPRHLVNFRAVDLDRVLERAGYEVLRHKYFSLRDNPAGLASSLAPRLDPMARRVRKVQESSAARLAKDLAYLGLVGASVLPAMLEALFQAGSTVMVEARKAGRAR